MFKSLKTTLLLSHLSIIVLSNLVVGFLSYTTMINSLENKQKEHLGYVCEHAVKTIENYIDYQSGLLGRIAKGKEVVEFSEKYRELALIEYFSKYQNGFSSISYINEHGIEEVRVQGNELFEGELTDYGASPFFREAMQQTNRVLLFHNNAQKNNDTPVLRMAIAQYGYFEDRFSGFILAELTYRKIAENIASLSIGPKGFYALHDGHEYSVVVSPSFKESDRITIYKGLDIPHEHDDSSRHEMFYSKINLFGQDNLTEHVHVEKLGWTIMAALPKEILRQEAGKIRNMTLIAFCLMGLLAWAAAYFLSKGIATPLVELTNASRAISKGKRNEPISIKSNNEVGNLVQSFNSMIRNLEETTVSRNYFNTIISSMQESLIVLGENGTIKTVNSATCTLLGYSRDELMGKDMRNLFKNAAHDECIFAKNDFGEKPVNDLELEYMTKDGREIPVLFSAAPMENMDNDYMGIVCLAIDISRRRKVEKELKKIYPRLDIEIHKGGQPLYPFIFSIE